LSNCDFGHINSHPLQTLCLFENTALSTRVKLIGTNRANWSDRRGMPVAPNASTILLGRMQIELSWHTFIH